MNRIVDVTGVSGTGIILYGIEWTRGGKCDIYWVGTGSTSQFASLKMVEEVHGHGGTTEVVFLDE